MAKICIYCGRENDDSAFLCRCNMPLPDSTVSASKTEHKDSSDTGYWQITCPQCGKKYIVDSADAKIELCERCDDEFEAEQIMYESARFICDNPASVKNICEAPEQESKIPQKLELVDLLTNKTIAEITEPSGVLGRWGNVSKEYFKQYGQISHYHCRFLFFDNRWTIEHLSNTNLTEVNGVSLEHNLQLPLNDGDKILLADLLFEVRYVY